MTEVLGEKSNVLDNLLTACAETLATVLPSEIRALSWGHPDESLLPRCKLAPALCNRGHQIPAAGVPQACRQLYFVEIQRSTHPYMNLVCSSSSVSSKQVLCVSAYHFQLVINRVVAHLV